MTTQHTSLALTRTVSSAVWTLQEAGHYTIRSRGVTLGHVITVPDGSFIAFDGQATPLGRHHSLRAAQLSTLRAAGLADMPTMLRQLNLVLATVTGTCALVLLTAGLLILSVAP